jgi:hypothetical protein
MPAFVNPADFIKIGVIAFVFILGANYALRKAGLEQFTA